jgi:hypothetical protein
MTSRSGTTLIVMGAMLLLLKHLELLEQSEYDDESMYKRQFMHLLSLLTRDTCDKKQCNCLLSGPGRTCAFATSLQM